jgi:phosphoribosylanthranilate isomerase
VSSLKENTPPDNSGSGTGSAGPVVKVCGITCLEDAVASIELGANALGFNFYPRSPRFIEPARAAEILRSLPGNVTAVAVVVVDSGDDPRLASDSSAGVGDRKSQSTPGTDEDPPYCSLPGRVDWVQVHGARSQADLPKIDREILVATAPEHVSDFGDFRVIIDTSWGTGRLADWEALRGLGRDYILSGGLTPENVKEALEYLEPHGVDVCSGVEAVPGKKDLARLARFLETVRAHYGLSES